jgi:transmembrane sensor
MSNEHAGQAIEWFLKLRAPDASSSDRHAHSQWMAESQAHRDSYAVVEQQWRNLDRIEYWARGELAQLNLRAGVDSRRRARFWLKGLTVTAAVLALSAVAVMVQSPDAVEFETAKTEQRRLALADGSWMHLNSASAVEVNFTPHVRQIELKRGEGFFDVGHDQRRPFVVTAAGRSVIAMGTRFSVYLQEDDLLVTVLDGRVAIVREDGDQPAPGVIRGAGPEETGPSANSDRVFLEKDRQARFDAAGTLEELKEVKATDETAWLEGKLIFDGTPLRQAVMEMSRYIPGEVRVAPGVPDHPVTGIIHIRNTDAMVELLAQAVPVMAVRESSQLTVLYDAS